MLRQRVGGGPIDDFRRAHPLRSGQVAILSDAEGEPKMEAMPKASRAQEREQDRKLRAEQEREKQCASSVRIRCRLLARAFRSQRTKCEAYKAYEAMQGGNGRSCDEYMAHAYWPLDYS